MRVLRVLVVAVLSCGALLLVAPPAGAASSKAKTCKTLRQIDKELSKVDIQDQDAFDTDAYSEVGDAFHSAARKAKGKLKSALNTIGDVYDDLGDSDNYAEVLTSFGRNSSRWTRAIGTYTSHLATSCL